ncbi:MAG: LPS export ABC transporter permease LptG [Gammaproteobacteria bacterium]|nr:MAG: LPS export ABC transporter permease LptG [Gammaproteobacteria bacterium]
MKILDRYITKTLLKYSLSVMVILVGIFAFFKFLEEVNDIGRASYTLVDALAYIGLLIPSMTYMLSSLIILLGAILGLGYLASNSELIIMQGAGIPVTQITKTTLKISIVFILFMITFGEFIVPMTSDYANQYRAQALGQRVVTSNQQGFWIKDSDNFIHVDRNIDGQVFNKITLIKLNNLGELDSVVYSDTANFDGNTVELQQSKYYQIDTSKPIAVIDKQHLQKYMTEVAFDQGLIQSLKKEPKALSTWQLFRQVRFLSNNDLSSDAYEVELYSRLMRPFTLIAMIILSVPFVFGSLRDSTLGRKIFMGVVISLFFELLSRIGGMLSLRFDLNHLLSASLPTAVVFIVALLMLYRVSAR